MNPPKKKNNMKKILTSLIAVFGLSVSIMLLLDQIKKSNTSKQQKDKEYDLVMENIGDIVKKDNDRNNLSKDVALRIIKLQFEKAKLANRENLNENNVCEMNEKLKEHVRFSCKYSKNPEECAEKVFGIDTVVMKKALSVFNCK